MSTKSQSRRDVLRKAAAISAAASFGGIGTTGAIAATEAARSAAQRDLDLVLRQAAGRRDVAGVVAAAVAQDGILYEGAFGKRDLAKGTDMTLDSVFWIASMTKAITSAAAMQLVEQGKLQLEQPMVRCSPNSSRRRSSRVSTRRASRSCGQRSTRSRCGICSLIRPGLLMTYGMRIRRATPSMPTCRVSSRARMRR